jgi:hypothetical protein
MVLRGLVTNSKGSNGSSLPGRAPFPLIQMHMLHSRRLQCPMSDCNQPRVIYSTNHSSSVTEVAS